MQTCEVGDHREEQYRGFHKTRYVSSRRSECRSVSRTPFYETRPLPPDRSLFLFGDQPPAYDGARSCVTSLAWFGLAAPWPSRMLAAQTA